MAKIPQPQFNTSINVPQIGGSGLPVSPSVGPVGQGLQNLGSGLMARNRRNKREAEITADKAKTLDDRTWSANTYSEFSKELTDYYNNPDNYNSETFHKDLDEFTQGRISELEANAPSKEAAEQFKSRALGQAASRYDQAAARSTQTKIGNLMDSYDNEVQAMLYAYRNSENGIGDLENSRSIAIADAKETFADSPKLAKQIESQINLSIIAETIDSNPEYAKALLNEDKTISPEKRAQLLRQIDRSEKSVSALERDTFNRSRESTVFNAVKGDSYDKVPIEEYELYYDADKAAVMKRQDDLKVDAYKMANDFVDTISNKNSATQMQELEKLVESAQSPEQRAAIQQIIEPQVRANLEMIEKDPVSWVSRNNATIKRLDAEIEKATDEERIGLLTERNELVLQVQGYSDGVMDDSEYLNKPSNHRNLLTVDEATQLANRINRESPQVALDTIRGIMAEYPDEQHQWIVFNDLASIGKEKIRQEYAMAFQNADKWWIDSYLASLQNFDGLKELTQSTVQDIRASVNAHPSWMAFQTSIIGDNFQRASEIRGYKSGIEAFAKSFMARGSSLDEAVDKSINLLINESLGFTEINGEPMPILREKQDGTTRTDEEIADVGRRLNVALSRVDPRRIDQSNFGFLAGLGPDEERVERLQALRDAVTSAGFWQMSPDGQSALLYYSDDNNNIFQVREKDGTPLEIALDDLPSFTTERMHGRYGMKTFKESPKETYDLRVSRSVGFDRNRKPIRKTVTVFPTADFIR